MSAWICTDKHINTLISYAIKYRVHYTVVNLATQPHITITEENAEEVANILTHQNARSVHDRYEERAEGYFGKLGTGHKFKRVALLPDAVTILKLCNCYDYQACETDDYQQTVAADIIRSIKDTAITKLPGYDAAPWGI